jgi:cell division septation protein DedD
MVNIKRSERSQADIEFFLVDMKNIDSDQFGIDLDEEPKRKNSEKTSESTIHSSEKLKSRASDFGEDLTKHISEESISKVDKEITESKDKDEITGWDFGKRFWGLSPTSGESNKKELDKTEQKETIIKQNVFDDSKLGDEKDPAETTIKKNKIENLEIDMDDFQVSEKEEKIGKFERVRSITSSLNEEALSEESKGSEKIPDDEINIEDEEIDHDDEYKKITSKAEQFQSDKTKKSLEENVVIEKKKDNVRKDIKLNRAEAVRKHRRESRKSSAKKFLTIAFVFIVIAGVLYLLLKDSNIKENVEETLPPIERIDNATYIERTYDIPVTYPYLKPQTKIELTGFISKDSKDVKPEKIIEDKAPNKKVLENNPPINNKIVVEKPTTSFLVKKPSGTPVQSAYNIYKYKDIYIVQVAAFRRKNSAENEAEKYIAKGYNAFLEEAKIDGITWYRVRVGNFDTLEKAKRFRKSNN